MVAKFAISAVLAVVAVVIIIILIRKFEIPKAITDAGNFISDGFSGISEFFDGLAQQSEEQRKADETQKIFEKQLEQKEQDAIDAGFESVTEFERETDPNSIFNAKTDEDFTKFNPPGKIGFGFPELNDGRGLDDTPQNRGILKDFLSGKSTVSHTFGPRGETTSLIFPEAFADSAPPITTVIQDISPDRPLSLSQFNKKTSRKNRGSTRIQGTVRSELETDQRFEAFSSDSSRPVRGVIRKTKQDPVKLKVDSLKNPLETASQRANRVFIESGKFADEDRGATSAKTKLFGFGTNTGSGLSIQTRGNTASNRLKDRMRRAEQDAIEIFDSRSISNF